MHDFKSPANDAGIAEEFAQFLRSRICGNVEVLGMLAQEQIPDASAYEESRMTSVMESAQNLERIGRNILAGNTVLIPVQDGRSLDTR